MVTEPAANGQAGHLMIRSGGQSGADRAGLDAAIRCNIPYCGWVPKGGRCEDLPDGELLRRYPLLRECGSSDYRVRTRLNIRDSHATPLFTGDGLVSSPGSRLTVNACRELGRPCLVLRMDDLGTLWAALEHLPGCERLGAYEPYVLNIAGSRESRCPGIHDTVLTTLTAVLQK